MQLPFPRLWHVVCVMNDFHHQQLRVEDLVIFWDHASSDSEDGTKDCDIEEHCSVRRNLKVREDLWIENRGEQKHCSKRACNERDESSRSSVSSMSRNVHITIPHDQGNFVIGELADVHARRGIRFM